MTTSGYDIHRNSIHDNTSFCPAGPNLPATSGAGVAIAGERSITVRRNTIARNRPKRSVPVHGGAILVTFSNLQPKDDHCSTTT